MTERPIIFSGAMVRAILEGCKTQTRRLIKPQPVDFRPGPNRHPTNRTEPYFDAYCGANKTEQNPRGMSGDWCWWTADNRPAPATTIHSRYGIPGDRLWVRETWAPHDHQVLVDKDLSMVYYPASDETEYESDCTWRPSIFMPRWASRLTLEITGVRVERLQDISETDSKAEGMEQSFRVSVCVPGQKDYSIPLSYKAGFVNTWEHLNSKRASWSSNPWVWVIEFKRVTP